MEEIAAGDRDSLALALPADTDGGLDAQRVARTIDAIAHTAGPDVRRYLLWLRLIDAIEAFSAGDNLTQAAHGAGFADSAHLSRTFHRMFGMTPSTLQHGTVEIRTVTDA